MYNEIKCLKCISSAVKKNGHHKKMQRYKCLACGYTFAEKRDSDRLRFICIALHKQSIDIDSISMALNIAPKIIQFWIEWYRMQ